MQWKDNEPGSIVCNSFWILYDPDGTTANFTAYHGDQKIGRTSTLRDAKTLVADLAEIGITVEMLADIGLTIETI